MNYLNKKFAILQKAEITFTLFKLYYPKSIYRSNRLQLFLKLKNMNFNFFWKKNKI